MNDLKPLKIFIIAGEASGDLLGAKLCRQLKKNRKCLFKGVAGDKMIAEGVKSIFSIAEISLMGFVEIIPHIKKLYKLINFTIAEIKKFSPDIIITIDSPGFCFRVMKKLPVLKAKKIHYVAPSVWLKPKRVYFMEKYYDKVLALLPFEPPYFKNISLPCKFVGHPILEENLDQGNGKLFRKKHNIPLDNFLLTVMTGSRLNEVKRMLPIFIDAINKLITDNNLKNVWVAFPYISTKQKKHINQFKKLMKFQCLLVEQDSKKDLYAASNMALVKSGTSSLELAIAKVPMVVAYKVNFLTAIIAKYIFKFKGFVSIINILADKMIIPEKLQEDCNPIELSLCLQKLLDPCYANKQISESSLQLNKLKREENSSPSSVAASEILAMIES